MLARAHQRLTVPLVGDQRDFAGGERPGADLLNNHSTQRLNPPMPQRAGVRDRGFGNQSGGARRRDLSRQVVFIHNHQRRSARVTDEPGDVVVGPGERPGPIEHQQDQIGFAERALASLHALRFGHVGRATDPGGIHHNDRHAAEA